VTQWAARMPSAMRAAHVMRIARSELRLMRRFMPGSVAESAEVGKSEDRGSWHAVGRYRHFGWVGSFLTWGDLGAECVVARLGAGGGKWRGLGLGGFTPRVVTGVGRIERGARL
jgi:hypothetical protein